MILSSLPLLGSYRSLPGSVWKLLSLQFLMSATHFMVAPIIAFYLAERLDFAAAQLGTVLSIHLISARALPAITGPLADCYGPRPLMTAGLAARGFGLLVFSFSGDWRLLSVAALVMGLGTAAYESAVYGVFARYSRKTAARIFVLNNQALNLGVILGPTVGAGIHLINASYVFITSGLLFIILALVAKTVVDLPMGSRAGTLVRGSILALTNHKTFLYFLVVTLPWWFLFAQLYVVFPIHGARLTSSEAGASLVFLVNGLAGSVFLVIGLYVFERLRGSTIVALCYAGLVPAYSLVAATDGMLWFLIFVCLYTLSETLILPALRATVAELATPGHESTFQGMLNLGWAVAGSLGNYAGGWLILEGTNSLTWFLFSGCAAVGAGLAMWFRSRQSNASGAGPASGELTAQPP